jgi:hypothetical protein
MPFRVENRFEGGENSILRKMFGLQKVEVTGGWKKLHTEELYSFVGLLVARYY